MSIEADYTIEADILVCYCDVAPLLDYSTSTQAISALQESVKALKTQVKVVAGKSFDDIIRFVFDCSSLSFCASKCFQKLIALVPEVKGVKHFHALLVNASSQGCVCSCYQERGGMLWVHEEEDGLVTLLSSLNEQATGVSWFTGASGLGDDGEQGSLSEDSVDFDGGASHVAHEMGNVAAEYDEFAATHGATGVSSGNFDGPAQKRLRSGDAADARDRHYGYGASGVGPSMWGASDVFARPMTEKQQTKEAIRLSLLDQASFKKP